VIHGLSARWCPISPHFLTRWVSRLLGLAVVSWAFARVGVHRLSLRLPYMYLSVFPFTLLHLPSILGVFHSLLSDIGFHSCSYFTVDVFGRPFACSLVRWISRLGTGSGTQYCGPRGGTEVRMEQNWEISIRMSALAGITSDLGF